MRSDISRRVFLERLGAGVTLGGAGLSRAQLNGSATPPVVSSPNILIILVDQMRQPAWLNANQLAVLDRAILPNVFGAIRDKSFVFSQYFTAAANCTPARSTLLTGLYAPQTATYLGQTARGAPGLNPAFPTWGNAIQLLNPMYRNNVWWFGKWHLSDESGGLGDPLHAYGFRTRSFPGGSSGTPSPNGYPNEGINGGVMSSGIYQGSMFASDAMIAGDFVGWLAARPPSPWCATVSLINPHDIAFAPKWTRPENFPPRELAGVPVYFPPPSGTPPALYSALPNPWNYEVPESSGSGKPSFHSTYNNILNVLGGRVTDWMSFLNQYYWLQGAVDQQVGRILNALSSSPYANNTIIVFTSDHGEFGGSHGMRGKGGAVYDEGIRIPLYVRFPGQTTSVTMPQMCSSVDFFGFICDLATAGAGQWSQVYPDLARRQSLWRFLYSGGKETRTAPGLGGIPYILHTFDEITSDKSHIVCLRTKFDQGAGQYGAKLAIYSQWAACDTSPDATAPEVEFYDYSPLTTGNRAEVGNDYFNGNSAVQNKLARYIQELGEWTPTATGLIGSELDASLVGLGSNGQLLREARLTARRAYLDYASASGVCAA